MGSKNFSVERMRTNILSIGSGTHSHFPKLIILLFVFTMFTATYDRDVHLHYPEAHQVGHAEFDINMDLRFCYWQIARRTELGTLVPLKVVADWYDLQGWEGELGNDQSWNKGIRISNLVRIEHVALIYTPEFSANILTMTRLSVKLPTILCRI